MCLTCQGHLMCPAAARHIMCLIRSPRQPTPRHLMCPPTRHLMCPTMAIGHLHWRLIRPKTGILCARHPTPYMSRNDLRPLHRHPKRPNLVAQLSPTTLLWGFSSYFIHSRCPPAALPLCAALTTVTHLPPSLQRRNSRSSRICWNQPPKGAPL